MTNEAAIRILKHELYKAQKQPVAKDTNVPINDLISRREAIDAVQHAFDKETLLSSFVRKVAVDALKTMPSAQPEETCDTCKHSPFGDSRCEKCRVGCMSYPSYHERRTYE